MVAKQAKKRNTGAGRARRATGVVMASLSGPYVRVLQAAARGGDLAIQRRGSAPAGNEDEALGRSLLEALSQAGIAERRVVVCLPAQSMALKRVRLPAAAPEQLPQLVAFEAQRHLPLPMEQLASGFQVMPAPPALNGKAEGEGTEVLLGVVRKGDLSRIERVLAGVGVEVEGYAVDALGAINSYLPEAGPMSNGGSRLLLAADGSSIHAQVLLGERLLFSRSLDLREEDWGADLRRSLTAYSLEHPETPIEDVVLTGEADEGEVARAVGMPVHAVRGETEGVPAGWEALAGAAREWLDIGRYPLRIEPQGWSTANAGSGRTRILVGAVAALALLAAFAVWRIDRRRVEGDERARAGRIARATERSSKLLEGRRKERDALRTQLAALGGGDAPAPLEVLRQVSARAPAEVWLTRMTYQAGKPLQLEGSSRTPAQATSFLRSLDRMPGVRRAELGFLRSSTVEDTPATQFRIDVLLAGEARLAAPPAVPKVEEGQEQG